jgi:hypothetical protein
MDDYLFQIFLFFAGALIGVYAQTRTARQLKIIGWLLAALLLAVSLFWAGYSTGYREGLGNAIASGPASTSSSDGSGSPCPEEPSEVVLEYGRVVEHRICPEGDTDIFRFTGTSGERIRIRLSYQDGSMRPCMDLIAPDNSRTGACENAFHNVIDMTLDQTGTYTILVDVLSIGVGSYSLVVERL